LFSTSLPAIYANRRRAVRKQKNGAPDARVLTINCIEYATHCSLPSIRPPVARRQTEAPVLDRTQKNYVMAVVVSLAGGVGSVPAHLERASERVAVEHQVAQITEERVTLRYARSQNELGKFSSKFPLMGWRRNALTSKCFEVLK